MFCACRSSGAPADRRAGGPVVLSVRPRARGPSTREGRTGNACAPRVLLAELHWSAREEHAEHEAGGGGRRCAEQRVPSRVRHARQPVRMASRVQPAAAAHKTRAISHFTCTALRAARASAIDWWAASATAAMAGGTTSALVSSSALLEDAASATPLPLPFRFHTSLRILIRRE